MARIQVTGYLNTEDMEPRHVDESHEMGLSEEGYTYWATELALDDVEFKQVYVTKSGHVLTDVEIQALSDEAEQGYDVSQFKSTARLKKPFQEGFDEGRTESDDAPSEA